MEEAKTYIESGILELYVLGQLSAIENEEVLVMASKYEEVKSELLAIEIAMESYALENAINPSANLGERILAGMEPVNAKTTIDSEVKVVPLHNGANESKIKVLRFALVACAAMLVISVAALFSVYSRLNTAHEQIASLSSGNDKYARTVNKLEFDKAGMENRIAMTETDEWTTVKLAGVTNSPKSKMLVYWNKTDKSILINHVAMDLPKADDSHQYQLWALVNGKPVSLGVFGEGDKEAVKQMETIQQAQAFAVTIEPTGGSVNPTMEKMVVMGDVSI